MPALVDDFHLDLLKACEQAAPAPFFTGDYAAKWGLEPSSLEETLAELRTRGLVHVTDWVPAKGNGYALSAQGVKLLKGAKLDSEPEPQEQPESAREHEETIQDRLPKPARPIVSRLLLALNLLMFLAGLAMALERGVPLGDYLGFEVVNPGVNGIRMDLGALDPRDVIVKQQWWRLLSYVFVHVGLLDLFLSVYILFSLGPAVEMLWGRWRFLVLYVVSVWTGGCAAMLVMRWALGDSAAFHGLVASYVVWVLLNRRALPPGYASRALLSKFWLVLILFAFAYFFPGMTWQTSVGGAIGGALVSIPLHFSRARNPIVKLAGFLGIVAVPALALGLVARAQGPLPESLQVQRDLFPRFQSAEDKAATVYNKQAVPLMRAWRKDIDPAQLTAARVAFKGAQEQVREAARALDDAGPFQDRSVTAAVGKARAYLEEWSRFYNLLTRTVEPPQPWPDEQYRALASQLDEIARASRPLAKSALFPSAYGQKQQ